ncbi:MAG: hypothetical protein AAF725_14565, partial [Acidobacteriota bacterium]
MKQQHQKPALNVPWIALTLALALSWGLAAGLGAQTPDADEPASPEASSGPDLEALATLGQEDRFRAMRAMSRDDRLIVLKSMAKEERRAYRRFGREASALTQPDPLADGYQALAAARPVAAEARPATKVAGTSIQYDSGTVTGTFTAQALGRFVGNRYQSALNPAGTALVPVEQSGTITMLTFDMVRTFMDTVTWSLYDNITGTSARQVESVIIPVAVG